MISFDLKCVGNHVFEVWFRSSADYEAQCAANLIQCPLCGDQQISKAVMAPAVAAKGNRRRAPSADPAAMPYVAAGEDGEEVAQMRALMARLAEAQARMLKQSQWVGGNFESRARAIHAGEAEDAVIHGTASLRDARAMMEDGLPVAPLLVPIAPPDRTN